jgi:CDGSH-type Zn-finger protein
MQEEHTKAAIEVDVGRIKVTKSGPYIVTGSVPLLEYEIVVDEEGCSVEWRDIKKYPLQVEYALCRCGNSGNKPFCDKSHLWGFDYNETASKQPYLEQAERIEGPDLSLTDAEDLCSFARFCDRAGGIWDLTLQSNEPGARQIAIKEAGNCPSGRLVVWDKGGGVIEPPFQPSIVLVNDPQEGVRGPIWVRGGIPVEAADGEVYEIRNRVTLCRCGMSINKPFCDSSHIQLKL